MPNKQNYRRTKNPVTFIDFDPQHFLRVALQHDMNFADICRFLGKSPTDLQLAIERRKINPRWATKIAKRIDVSQEDLLHPTVLSTLPLKIYISIPRTAFGMSYADTDQLYDYMTLVIERFLQPLSDNYPDATIFEVMRPDTYTDDEGNLKHTRNYIGRAVSQIRKADLVFFAPQWEADYICKIEHQVAEQYAKQFIYVNDEVPDILSRFGLSLENNNERSR